MRRHSSRCFGFSALRGERICRLAAGSHIGDQLEMSRQADAHIVVFLDCVARRDAEIAKRLWPLKCTHYKLDDLWRREEVDQGFRYAHARSPPGRAAYSNQ